MLDTTRKSRTFEIETVSFEHESLPAYQAALGFVRWVSGLGNSLGAGIPDAWYRILRSSQAIPPTIAEGLGRKTIAESIKCYEMAHGYALECAASLDVLVAAGGCVPEQIMGGKQILTRIVSHLKDMIENAQASEIPLGQEEEEVEVIYHGSLPEDSEHAI
ncbi:MAG: four helix bundle protein [Candidatus Hydrogenedentes bacterium]|nr:four helix bundle protein [Candidatus Hydrogenedentota bacterium]